MTHMKWKHSELVSLSRSLDQHFQSLLQQSSKVAIRYYTHRGWSSFAKYYQRHEAFSKIINKFHKRHPKIKVEEIFCRFEDAGDYVKYVDRAIVTGATDVAWINFTQYANYLENGYLKDLTPYLPQDESDNFFDWAMKDIYKKYGTIAAIWQTTDTPIFYYHSDYITDPPETWSEVVELARSMKSTDHYPIVYPMRHWTQFNSGMFSSLGGRYLDESGYPIYGEKENYQILEYMFSYYLSLLDEGLIPSESIYYSHGDQMPDVYRGKVVGFVGNSNDYLKHLEIKLSADEYSKWQASRLPRPDDAEKGGYEVGGWMIAPILTGNTQREDAAAKFVVDITNREGITLACRSTGTIPTRPEIIETDEYYRQDRFMQIAVQSLQEGGWVPPMHAIWGTLQSGLKTAMRQVLSRQMTVSEALDTAYKITLDKYADL